VRGRARRGAHGASAGDMDGAHGAGTGDAGGARGAVRPDGTDAPVAYHKHIFKLLNSKILIEYNRYDA
jgi:hypothetical protein